MTGKTLKRRLYDRFCDSLIMANNDPDKDPKTRAEASAMYSFEEYVLGGAYDEDLETYRKNQAGAR